MIKKVLSLALAISMLATAFVALNVAAATPTLTGSIVATDNNGIPQTVFFTGDAVYFILTYTVDGVPTNGQFTVQLLDGGGNVVATKNNVHTGLPANGQHNSSRPGGAGSFAMLGSYGTDTMTIRALLDTTGQSIATATFKLMQNRIIIEPLGRTVFSPGETITIKIDFEHPDGANGKMNVSIWPDSTTRNHWNATWHDVQMTNFHWETIWTIPDNASVGWMSVYLALNTNNATLFTFWDPFDIEYFEFVVKWDRDNSGNQATYLPGETAIVSFYAWSLPDFLPINITLDFNLSYDDGAGNPAWLNMTETSSPFNVTIPSWQDTYPGLNIYYKAMAAFGHNATGTRWIDMGTVHINSLTLDKATYHPGDTTAVVSIVVWAKDPADSDYSPLPNAAVTITMDDGQGNALPVNITTTTNSMGTAQVALTLPANLTEDWTYRVIARATKLVYSDQMSVDLPYMNDWRITATTDKNMYITGQTIAVTVEVLKNGVAVNPDSVDYELQAEGIAPAIVRVNSLNFTVVAPATNDDSARIMVEVHIGSKTLSTNTVNFAISMIELTLSASKLNYYAGDSIDFQVLVQGNAAGFSLRYTITDNDLIQVGAGALTLSSDNKATFTLNVPAVKNAEAYVARVYADNGAGVILMDELTVLRATNYQVVLTVKTAPASTSGAYAPGQTIVVGFEIIKQSSDLRDLATVTAVLLDATSGILGQEATFTAMKGELSVTLPKEASTGLHDLAVTIIGLGTYHQTIVVDSQGNGIWNSNVGGMMSVADLLLLILVVIVIVMLLWMMMGSRGGAAAAVAEPKPAAPKETKTETYQPKSTVKCPSCGNMIEVATSKRPIEVMCPKCGTSQIVN